MIGAYLRVSSASQNLATQRAELERAARARGDRISKWFHEKRSGRTLERPELARVRAAARTGALRTLYVHRLDRLTRSGIRDTLALLEELRGAGCRVVTTGDGFDLQGPAADVVVAVLAWAAQMERQAIGERIRAARARVEAAGGRWGRPRRIAGELERRALELKRAGRSVRAIAVALKVPRSTVQRALQRARRPRAAAPSQCRAFASDSPQSNRRTNKARASVGSAPFRSARARADK